MGRFLFAAASAATFFAVSGFAALTAPTAPAKASDSRALIARAPLLPDSVIEQARTEGETPAAALPATDGATPPEKVRFIASSDDKSAGSLAELVSRYSSSETAGREAECLAVAVYYESKSEPLSGQLAVAHTVINRTKSGRFPSSVCGVVLQRSQFSFVRGGALPSVPRGSKQWKTAVAIGHIARNDMWDGAMKNALFFHATRVSPGWRLSRIGTVGNHVFYR